MKNFILLTLFLISVTPHIFSQNVGVGTTAPTHTFHVVPSTTNDPVRIEGVNVFISETNLLAIDTATGVIRYMPIANIVGNINFDSIVIQNLLTNGDTLLYNTSFVDSLIALMRDSVDTDVDSLTLVGDTLSVYENMKKYSVSLASLGVDSTFIDSLLSSTYFTDSIYAFISDSLLRDSLWVDSLKNLIETDVDSATYFNDTLTIYENGKLRKVRIPTSDTIIVLTYDSLKTLVDSSWLIPGKKYLINDFQTLHIIPNTTDRNDANLIIPIEPLIVTAMQPNQLDVRAHSTVYPKDLIYYTVDNAWWGNLVDVDSKGAITFRKSSSEDSVYTNVSVPQDFRAVVLRRWNVDLTSLTNVSSNYVLYDTTVSIGREHGTRNPMTLNAVSPSDFSDHFMFDTNYIIKDVELGKKRWWGTNNNIINAVFKNNVRGIDINTVDEWHCEWEIMHLHGGEISSTINASSPNGLANPGSEIWHQNEENVGSIRGVFVNVSSYWNSFYQNLQGTTIVQDTSSFYSNYRANLSNGFIKDVINASIKLKNNVPNRRYDVQVSNLKGCGHSMTLESSDLYHPSIVKDLHYAGLVNDCSSAIYNFSNQSNQRVQYIGGVTSTIESTKAASANLNSVRNSWTQYDELAGIYNLTGSGTVNIQTITSSAIGEPRVPLLLRPDSGLVIVLNPNNIANGFMTDQPVIANGNINEVIQLEWKYDRWIVVSGRKKNSITTVTTVSHNLNEQIVVGDLTLNSVNIDIPAGYTKSFAVKMINSGANDLTITDIDGRTIEYAPSPFSFVTNSFSDGDVLTFELDDTNNWIITSK